MFLRQYPIATTILILLFTMVTQPLAAQTIKSYIDNEWPDDRYTNHGNGTVTDNVTGLIWQCCAIGQSGNDCATGSASSFNWKEALAEAANSNHAGFSDWRLPNMNELTSLVAYDRYGPAININAFPNAPSSYFWSSSPHPYGGNGWNTNFYNLDHFDNNRSNDYHVRLVRSGQ